VDRDLFAIIACMLFKMNILDHAHFVDHFLPRAFSSNSRTPSVTPMGDIRIWDWKRYFANYLVPLLTNHSFWRSFKWVKVGARVLMFYKENALSPTWIGYDQSLVEGKFLFLRTFFLPFATKFNQNQVRRSGGLKLTLF
jgi:hypothetical protein